MSDAAPPPLLLQTTHFGECAPFHTTDVVWRATAAAVLKNMTVHELALAVTYYGVTADSIASVDGDEAFSVCETRNVCIPVLSCSLSLCMGIAEGVELS